jgi:ribonuclease-3
VARNLELERFILMSRGERLGVGRGRLAILANCMEALIGAIFLDQGLQICTRFVGAKILVGLPEVLKNGLSDPKSDLQQICQERYKCTPEYRVIRVSGKDHVQEFLVGVYIGKQQIGIGTGPSKKEAGLVAAQNALDQMTTTAREHMQKGK